LGVDWIGPFVPVLFRGLIRWGRPAYSLPLVRRPDRRPRVGSRFAGAGPAFFVLTERSTHPRRAAKESMSDFNPNEQKARAADAYNDGIDYKNVDELRRMMTPNGKIYSRKRLALTARGQRRVAQAIKRARYMALLPYTSATL